MSGRYTPSPTKHFSPLLRRLVRAAEAECPPGHAETLAAFIGCVVRKRPPATLADPRAMPELHAAIQAIARAHFEIDEALRAWRGARMSMAAGAAAGVSQTDYDATFYAGVIFGLLFLGLPAIVSTQR